MKVQKVPQKIFGMKILAVSDIEVEYIYSPRVVDLFGDFDILISCGDLSYNYLEYIISMLDIRSYFVHGNHDQTVEFGSSESRDYPWGAINLHRSTVRDPSGLILAGIEGSLLYSHEPYQYTQQAMWGHAFSLVHSFFWNRIRYGRYVDIMVTHAPPWRIHDHEDRAHQGIKAIRWLISVFKPAILIHGHVHYFLPGTVINTLVGETIVVNAYKHRELIFDANKIMHKPIELDFM